MTFVREENNIGQWIQPHEKEPFMTQLFFAIIIDEKSYPIASMTD
jgi:hypothetical protein